MGEVEVEGIGEGVGVEGRGQGCARVSNGRERPREAVSGASKRSSKRLVVTYRVHILYMHNGECEIAARTSSEKIKKVARARCHFKLGVASNT
jgi:hypothetical protein